MSFAGHVYDMIRRDKENRALKKQRREKAQDIRQRYLEVDKSYPEPDVTLEEFEEINRQLKEREAEEKRYYRRSMLIIAGILFVLLVLLWILL